MLMVAKVPKFSGITIMGLVVGLFLFSSGHFALSLVASIVFSVAADIMGKLSNYRSKKNILLSYVVFSYGLMGPVLPMWFMKDAYVANLEGRGKDAVYIDSLFEYINTGTFIIAVIAILVCAVLGGLFGQKMLKKHFAKAGIV